MRSEGGVGRRRLVTLRARRMQVKLTRGKTITWYKKYCSAPIPNTLGVFPGPESTLLLDGVVK